MRIEAADTNRGNVRNEGRVDRPGPIVADTPVVGRRNSCSRSSAVGIRVRHRRYVLDQAAHCACAVEGALRASQHFHTVEIEKPDVERQLRKVAEWRAGAVRDVIHVDTNSRRDVRAGRDAAQVHLILTDTVTGDAQAGHRIGYIPELGGTQGLRSVSWKSPLPTAA